MTKSQPRNKGRDEVYQWIEYLQDNPTDEVVQEKLVLAYKDLVESLARKYSKNSSIHEDLVQVGMIDRKSTRLNSSHVAISYAVFCLKKKKKHRTTPHHKKHPNHTPHKRQNTTDDKEQHTTQNTAHHHNPRSQ